MRLNDSQIKQNIPYLKNNNCIDENILKFYSQSKTKLNLFKFPIFDIFAAPRGTRKLF